MATLTRLKRWWSSPATVMLPPRDGYALWAERYPPRPHNPLMDAEQQALAPIIHAVAADRALDIGTGTGRNLRLLAAAGASLVVGLDFSDAMLSRHERPLPRVCADATDLSFRDGAFDLVSASLMVGDISDLSRLMAGIARVLSPGGHVVYSDFHPTWANRRWRRTFVAADGRSIELPYVAHTMDMHLSALAGAGFVVRRVLEPRVGEDLALVVFHATRS